MKNTSLLQLEDIPNIGKAIAADLRAAGIQSPEQLLVHEPLDIYLKLAAQMGRRHDPCVLYTLLAAKHYLQSGEKVGWWKFTEQGKCLLQNL
jgi:DNA transformation protein